MQKAQQLRKYLLVLKDLRVGLDGLADLLNLGRVHDLLQLFLRNLGLPLLLLLLLLLGLLLRRLLHGHLLLHLILGRDSVQ